MIEAPPGKASRQATEHAAEPTRSGQPLAELENLGRDPRALGHQLLGPTPSYNWHAQPRFKSPYPDLPGLLANTPRANREGGGNAGAACVKWLGFRMNAIV